MNFKKPFYLLVASCLLFTACKPSPESLEKWRNAEGGLEKLADYAEDPSMPDAVRTKAFEILTEEAVNTSILTGVLKDVTPNTATQFADKVAPIIKASWDKNDFPTEEKVRKSGGKLNVAGSRAVLAKDLAFFLVPYATGEAKNTYESILSSWLSTDYELRNQLGATTLAQIAPLAGELGLKNLKQWLTTSIHPAQVARSLRENANEQIEAQVAEIISERAIKEYPNISDSLTVAIIETTHKNILPYLEKVLKDPEAPPKLYDDALDTYIKIEGESAAPLLIKLVTEMKGNIRWLAAQRVIELVGKKGLHDVAEALPEEYAAYEGAFEWTLNRESKILCNFFISEMKKRNETDFSPAIIAELTSKRWPNQLLGMQCAAVSKLPEVKISEFKSKIESLKSSKAVVPRWNTKGEPSTIGKIAREILTQLETPPDKAKK